MKLILLQNIPDLGKEGDVVEVSDGHARNFLLPQNAAVPATPQALAKREAKVQALSRKEHKELSVAGDLARRLEGHEIVLQEKVSEGGKLFGSVSASAIAAALKRDGLKVEEGWIVIEAPIKELGEHAVGVSLPHGFEAQIRIVIEAK